MKFFDILDLFRKGSEVSNPEVWKDSANTLTYLVPAIVALTKVAGDFGYGVTMDTETATKLAGGIVIVVHWIVLNVSSKKAGVLPARDTGASPPSVSTQQANVGHGEL